MELLLPALLVLPFAVAAVILTTATVRRRRHSQDVDSTEPVHRAQAGTAAAQDAVVQPASVGRSRHSGRERRAGAAARPKVD